MQLLTVKEAAEKLGIGNPRVYQLIRSGALKAQKVSNVWLIDESSVFERKKKKHKPGRPSRVSKANSAQYILMNRQYPVLTFDYDLSQKRFSRALEIIDSKRAPLAFLSPRGLNANSSAIKFWWEHRSIPKTRKGVEEKLQELKLDLPYELPFASFGLSLSDQYWICPISAKNLQWEDINFFNNEFESIISLNESSYINVENSRNTIEHTTNFNPDSNARIDATKNSEHNYKDVWVSELGLNSPDNTSEGQLKKIWACNGKKRILLKGSSALGQEPYNEVIASRLFSRLLDNSEYVEYFIDEFFGQKVSKCECFLHDDEEYIPAYYVLNILKKPKHHSNFQHLIDCLEVLDISDSEIFLSKMIVCDDILGNFDRHFRNFGIIRNTETLQCRMAPLFDSGSSLWCNKTLSELKAKYYTFQTKPFYEDANRQLRLVNDYSWFDISLLEGFAYEASEILSQVEELKERIPYIIEALKQRIKRIENIL